MEELEIKKGDDEKLKSYKGIKKVVKSGNSAHVILPKGTSW